MDQQLVAKLASAHERLVAKLSNHGGNGSSQLSIATDEPATTP
jgi:hypothetical protein